VADLEQVFAELWEEMSIDLITRSSLQTFWQRVADVWRRIDTGWDASHVECSRRDSTGC